jgi:hypothetical protein
MKADVHTSMPYDVTSLLKSGAELADSTLERLLPSADN